MTFTAWFKPAFPIGTRVQRKTRYKWPGVVVAAFKNLDGEEHCVVECVAPGCEGALHVYFVNQLEARNE